MRVRCTATALIIRGRPGGVDIGQRLTRGEEVEAFGQSFDERWVYIAKPQGGVEGWISAEHVEPVADTLSTPPSAPTPVKVEWIGCAQTNFRRGRRHTVDLIVIHVIEGSLKSCDNWFNNPAAQVSAHYGIGLHREIHQYVKEADTAFHAGRVDRPVSELVRSRAGKNPNDYSIGIEHEGTADSEWPDTLYADSALLVALIAKQHNIPLDRKHVVAHREIYAPKTCPGKGDVDRIVAMARDISLL